MKKTVKVIGIVICILLVAFFVLRWIFYLDLSGAYYAKLVYQYDDTNISCQIDWDDRLELQEILCGVKFKDTPSCGFGTEVSVTFTVGADQKEITICPACDGCPLMRIGDSDYYIKISEENRARFNEIVEKYGMVFPCI